MFLAPHFMQKTMTLSLITTYQKLCTEFYDLEPHHNHEAAVRFYQTQAIQARGPILEPMCGTGRFLLPLLHAGFDAEGFDASPHMLEALRQKYAQMSDQPAPVWQQLIQDFDSKKQYTLIFIPYGSFGLITNRNDAQQALAALHRHLAPGGKMIIEIETTASVPATLNTWCRGVHTRADGSNIALNTYGSYDEKSQLFSSICRYESWVDGVMVATETEDFQQYLYEFDEFEQLLMATGFKNIQKYSDYAQSPAKAKPVHTLIYACIG